MAKAELLAEKMTTLAIEVESKHFRDRTADEVRWAKETIADQVHGRIRAAAMRGARQIVVDGPESDFISGVDTVFVRGGMAVIQEVLRQEGFGVKILNRYAGHAYGQYGLEVTW